MGYSADRVDEERGVADPIFEQIPDPLGAISDKFERVATLEVLGEHDNPHLRVSVPDSDCRA